MNQVALIGNLVRDPDARTTTNGAHTAITKLRIAVSRAGRDGADFIDVTAFGRLAEVCVDYLTKGSRVGITGRLAHREWPDTDGNRRQALDVIAASVDFLLPRRSEDAEPVSVTADPEDIPF